MFGKVFSDAVYPRVCGGTPSPRHCKSQWAVYPRVCGGTPSLVCGFHSAIGLSPRVRGNLVIILLGRIVRRSIPACAGEP